MHGDSGSECLHVGEIVHAELRLCRQVALGDHVGEARLGRLQDDLASLRPDRLHLAEEAAGRRRRGFGDQDVVELEAREEGRTPGKPQRPRLAIIGAEADRVSASDTRAASETTTGLGGLPPVELLEPPHPRHTQAAHAAPSHRFTTRASPVSGRALEGPRKTHTDRRAPTGQTPHRTGWQPLLRPRQARPRIGQERPEVRRGPLGSEELRGCLRPRARLTGAPERRQAFGMEQPHPRQQRASGREQLRLARRSTRQQRLPLVRLPGFDRGSSPSPRAPSPAAAGFGSTTARRRRFPRDRRPPVPRLRPRRAVPRWPGRHTPARDGTGLRASAWTTA